MKRIAITGGSGYFGSYAIKEFIDQGYEVINIDTKSPRERCRTLYADLINPGEAYGALREARPDAVINLAAIPVAYKYTDEMTIRTNILLTYNVLEAATALGVKKIALASSDSSYGVVFSRTPILPVYLPIDEAHPQIPEDPYGFSKLINEETAKMFCRRTGAQIVCLRFVHISMPDSYADLMKHNRELRHGSTAGSSKEIWNYVDARDAARACRLAVEKDSLGYCAVNIVADDTCMDIPSKELIAEYFPGIRDIRADMSGYSSLTSNRKAWELMGWKPQHSWRG
ncbi:MAG TPA: nucleoside-diphosphate-sugar epimerase [Clostridiales bacterium]|nr:nucleoside-diphosphate-sugar epimerase [Clostridiales bacterium]